MKHILMILMATLALKATANEEDHDHDHGSEQGHAHEEESFKPKGGLLAADEHDGIKLSPTAQKNFDLEMVTLSGKAPWSVPESAVLHSGEEVNVYRLRDGFFKRVDFNKKSQSAGKITLESKDLQSGDQIVTRGLGFLRIAELSAFGGTPEGHSH